MIVLNFIFLPNISTSIGSSVYQQTNVVEAFRLSKVIKRNNIFLSYAINDLNYFDSKDKLARKKLIGDDKWRNLMNSYWKQKVFLSISDKLSDQYIAQLNSLNINRDKGRHKRLIAQFSKSLNDFSVNVNSVNQFSKIDQKKFSHIEYLWLKKLYFNPLKIFSIFSLNQENKYFDNVKQILNNMRFSYLPLYVVSNNTGQLIISEPPQNQSSSHNFMNILLDKSQVKNIHESWFFINFQDAQEYLEYVKKSYDLQSNESSLKLFTCNLETFYNITRKYGSQITFRLVPDLNEIGNLLNKYCYSKSISFHPKQKYGSDYFQGQPVYIVKAENQNYLKNLGEEKQVSSFLFTNYKTALTIWNKIQVRSTKQKNPKLVVYNLEDFLKNNIDASKDHWSNNELLLIPSEESYRYAKQENFKYMNYTVYNNLNDILVQFKLWTKRILWSLTSKQPKYD